MKWQNIIVVYFVVFVYADEENVDNNRRFLLSSAPAFHKGVEVGPVKDPELRAASGLAASRKHPNVLYTINPSHHSEPIIFVLDAKTGGVVAKVTIQGLVIHYWRAIAVGPCLDGSTCIFISDMGTDKGHPPENKIYIVEEPNTLSNQSVPILTTISVSYPEIGSDTMMVSPAGDIIIVALVHPGSGSPNIYRIAGQQWGKARSLGYVLTSSNFARISSSHKGPTDGAMSVQGTEILLKTDEHIYYWKVTNGDYMATLQSHIGDVLPYIYHRLTRSICWATDGSGYYTLNASDKDFQNSVLYFYKRG